MTMHYDRKRRKQQKRAIIAVQVAVLMTVLLGFAALTVDVGLLYNTRADLQQTADAAALAAAGRLSEYEEGDMLARAREAARQFTELNAVMGRGMTIDPAVDVTFGRSTFNEATQQYDFTPTEVIPDAVRVRVRHTAGSPNGSVSLLFARIFGFHSTEMAAEALAVMVPRDIAVVADLSGSHTDDSELTHYNHPSLASGINLYQVWDGLPGGVDEIGGLWDIDDLPPEWIEPDGSAPQAAGPAWGYMKELGYGTETVDADYDPVADAGLIRLAKYADWNNAQLEAYLSDRGYIASEINVIMSDTYDSSGVYPYRVAVALGLAYWNSGLPGGSWEQRGIDPSDTGNGNNWIGSSELQWTEAIFSKPISTSASIWLNYIDGYVAKTSNQMYQANSNFRYRFGVKTFTNYLMERRPSHSQTPELAETPHQPMQAVKDAVNFLVQFVDDLDTDDQLSLEVYGTTGRHEVDLTHNHPDVADRLSEMQAAHYDSWTNMGGGLERAIEELTSVRARGMSRKMIILLTDGNANVTATGHVDTVGGCAYALDQAQLAADAGIRIFAVSVGAGANQSLMQQIADIGAGEHFHAEGSIEQYSQELMAIFQRLGGTRPVELIQ